MIDIPISRRETMAKELKESKEPIDKTESKPGQILSAQSENLLKVEQEVENAEKTVEEKTKIIIAKSEEEVIKLCEELDQLESSSSPRLCELQIKLGDFLDKIEEKFSTKSDYIKWLNGYKQEHGARHTRMFQRAKQLRRIGKFAENHIHIGIFRLLEWDQMLNYKLKNKKKGNAKNNLTIEQKIKEKEKISNQILAKYSDSVQNNKKLEKEEVSAIITIERFRNVGIKYITFDQSKKMVEQEYGSIKATKVQEVKNWLESLGNIDDEKRERKINEFIDAKMMRYPDDWEPESGGKKVSVKTFFKKFISIGDKVDFDNGELIFDQKVLTKQEEKELEKFFEILGKFQNKIGTSARLEVREATSSEENGHKKESHIGLKEFSQEQKEQIALAISQQKHTKGVGDQENF
ncbi:MAG: hypothetical protein QG641_142 [Candidatus Poribacteria bacterium]|nr:hypothetical protein [Candidatus Poribacteria bacterium]